MYPIYKGKSLIDNTWVKGSLLTIETMPYPIRVKDEEESNTLLFIHAKKDNYMPDWGMPFEYENISINKNSLCEASDLSDSEDIIIFENDILTNCTNKTYRVAKIHSCFKVVNKNKTFVTNLEAFVYNNPDCKIIGNMIDNPDLFK